MKTDAAVRSGHSQDMAACAAIVIARNHTVRRLEVDGRYRNRGTGLVLVAKAKGEFLDSIQLWSFQQNISAQRFDNRQGFQTIHKTDGDNAKALPDYLLALRR